MKNLVASSYNKESLERLINKFYMSQNYFVNDENQAENRVTGKKLGIIKATAKRWKYFV